MLNRFKTALYNVVGSFDNGEGSLGALGPGVTSALPSTTGVVRTAQGLHNSLKEKGDRFPYTRPHFLQLNTEDEILVSADHAIRPIICPRDISRLPWNTGYSETINAGKSKKNEDQAVVHVGLLTRPIKLENSNSQSSNASREQKSNPLINGNSEESPPVKTVMLQPQTSSLSASPATELKEDYGKKRNSGLSDSSNSSGNSTLEQSNKNVNVEQSCISQQPLAEQSPSQAYETTPSHSLSIHRNSQSAISLPYYIFGVFDGHAGWGAAVSAANQLHHIIHEKLCDVIDIILPDPNEDKSAKQSPLWASDREVTVESAVTGALESAFWQMDIVIGEDRLKYQLSGGCTACVALFIHGKLFVANAGDSRSVASLDGQPHPMSFDFTPETETQRIRKLGAMHPELLGGEYTHLDFIRRPIRRDLGKRVMYRDHYMTGWAYKTLTTDDLKYPVVCGEGKRSRVLATIGVTRGFGDHDLKAQYSSIPIKPFLSPEPEVKILDLESMDVTDSDVLVLATDGLWDITTNDKAAEIVLKSLSVFPIQDQDKFKYRYTSAAQDLVMSARGKLKQLNWRTSDDKHATIDDISVFVIPLRPYKDEYCEWTVHQQASLNCSKNSSDNLTKEPLKTEEDKGSVEIPLVSPSDSDSSSKEVEVSSSSQEEGSTPSVKVSDISNTPPVKASDISPQEDHFNNES